MAARPAFVTGGALVALAALCWVWLWQAPMPMPASSGGLHTLHYFAVTYLMWSVMMVGMMTPSVAPTVTLFGRVNRHGAPATATARTAAFAGGYLLAWLGFSLLATVLQIALIDAGWSDAMGVSARPVLTAGLLLAIGVYQWLPAKRACLAHCRSPAAFLVAAHRPGVAGALQMGLRHGLYCIGCCWGLMLLLFVGGVMNLLWVAAIAALVLAEKLLPHGDLLRRLAGIAAVLAAIAVLCAQRA